MTSGALTIETFARCASARGRFGLVFSRLATNDPQPFAHPRIVIFVVTFAVMAGLELFVRSTITSNGDFGGRDVSIVVVLILVLLLTSAGLLGRAGIERI
jgi:hypothetical protein